MKKKCLLEIFFIIIIIITGCKGAGSSENTAKDKNKSLAFSNQIELFNELEKLVKSLEEKKYIEGYDSLEKVYEYSNKTSNTLARNSSDLNSYHNTLDQLSKDIFLESKKQKKEEIIFEYEKSQLTIISNITSDKNQDSGKEQDSSGQSGGQKESGGSGSEGNSSSSSEGGSSSQGSSKEEKQQIIIPQEEALKKYPELLITETDQKIKDKAIDLLGFITKSTLEAQNEKPISFINREKYYMHKIASSGNLKQYNGLSRLMVDAQNNWEVLSLMIQDKNKEDVAIFQSLLKNLKGSIEDKNEVAIELHTKVGIKLLDDISAKVSE